jgi:hypothetical protein
MRAISLLVCALLLLAGCKKGESPPQAALNQPDGSGSDANKDKQSKGKNKPGGQDGSGKQKGNTDSGAKGTKPEADGLAFDPQDPQKTLTWLIKRSEKLRSTPTDAQARQAYESAVKAAEKQKVQWTLKVDSLSDDPKGVVLKAVESPAEPKCSLHVAPKKDPDDPFTTSTLTAPAGIEFRRGDRVTVTGVIERIETDAGRCEFQVRLREGYTLTAPK